MKTRPITKPAVLAALTLATLLHPPAQKAMAQHVPLDSNKLKALDHGQPVAYMEPRGNGHNWVKAKVLIKANPRVVWDAVHEERAHDPDIAYSKVLTRERNQITLEQKYCLLPVIGSAVCLMKQVEIPLERIDYNMLKSDHFKAMTGSWIFTPHPDGTSTYLELTTYSDTGLPFPRQLVEAFTARKLQKRLTNVKRLAEALQERVARHDGAALSASHATPD